MKLPTALLPSLPGRTTSGTGTSSADAESGATASIFAARLGEASLATSERAADAAAGVAPEAGPDAASARAIVDVPGEESADPDDAGTSMESAQTADFGVLGLRVHFDQSTFHHMPATDAATTQVFAAAVTPANQLAAATDNAAAAQQVAAAPLAAVPGETPDSGPAGPTDSATVPGSAAVPAAALPASQPVATEPTPATAASPGDVPDQGAAAAAAGAMPVPGEARDAESASLASNPATSDESESARATAAGHPLPAATTTAAPEQPGAGPRNATAGAASAAAVPDAAVAAPLPATAAVQAAAAVTTTVVPTTAAAQQTAAGSEPQSQANGNGAASRLSAGSTPAGVGAAAAIHPGMGEAATAAPELARQPVDADVARSPTPLPAMPAPGVAATLLPAPAVPAQLPVLAPPPPHAAVPTGTPMLNEQLARPLFTLAAAPLGEHVMTINVIPDALGPVTVRAHLAADGIRIEMMAPSDAGRDGLRNILTDLRRDLAAGGMSASLSMGSGHGAQDHGGNSRSPQWSGNPWTPTALAEAHPAPSVSLAPSDVSRAVNNSLDITV